jgi:hypothetical protein
MPLLGNNVWSWVPCGTWNQGKLWWREPPAIQQYYLPLWYRMVITYATLNYCLESEVATDTYSNHTGTERDDFSHEVVLTCAATSPAWSLGKSVCDQRLLDQGTILRRSSPKRKSRSRLCRNFRMFHGRSLCLEHKPMTQLLVHDRAN